MIAFLVALGVVGVSVSPLPRPPIVDGDLGSLVTTPPTLSVAKGDSAVRVWVGRYGPNLYVSADLPDSSYYWGDDFVVSFDPDGSGGAAPGDGDRQWYLRRDVDSSVVTTAASGRWGSPATIGKKHRGEDWEAAARSTGRGWSVELRFRAPSFEGTTPRIAFRSFDDAPKGWWSWPAPPESTRATRIERQPDLWKPLFELIRE